MARTLIVSDRHNSFFSANNIRVGNQIPTEGNYVKGDIIVNIGESTATEAMWICVESGNPGVWEVVGAGAGGGSLVSINDSVFVNEPVNEVSLAGLGVGVSSKDKLLVHYNSTHLLEGVHFEISEDGTKIVKLGGGNWNPDGLENCIFALELFKGVESINGDKIVVDSKMTCKTNHVIIENTCSEVEIGIEGFNAGNDMMLVFKNGVNMVEGVDYEVQDGKIVSTGEVWNENGIEDYGMTFVVFKEVVEYNEEAEVKAENIADGSIGMNKLADDVKEAIEAAGNIDISGKQDTIDNNLATTDKTIVGAINELFQSANNGKQLIASAIGEPLNSNDTFSAMSDKINDMKSDLKQVLTDEGVDVTEEDDMTSLISKVDEEFDKQVIPAGDAVASNVLSGKTFINNTGQTITGTMANNGTKTITPKVNAQTLGAGYYDKITINGDADLVDTNIVSGKNIFGVTGTATVSAYPVWYNPENTWMSISTAELSLYTDNSKYTTALGDDIYIFNTSRYCKYNTKTNVCSEAISYTNTPSNSELSRGEFTVVNCNGLFYFIGGLKSYSSDRQNANNYLMTFNPSDNTWATKADMLTALNHPLACVYNNKIYVFGGRTYKEYYSGNYLYGYSNKSSMYDPSTNTWSSITDITNYKTLPPIVVNNCAYLPGTGGVTERYKYDFTTGTYTEITSGLSAGNSYTAYKNRIYGFSSSVSKMYDTITGTETDKTLCPTEKSGASSHTMGDIIYYISGHTKNSNGYFNTANFYGMIYIPEK